MSNPEDLALSVYDQLRSQVASYVNSLELAERAAEDPTIQPVPLPANADMLQAAQDARHLDTLTHHENIPLPDRIGLLSNAALLFMRTAADSNEAVTCHLQIDRHIAKASPTLRAGLKIQPFEKRIKALGIDELATAEQKTT